MPNQIPTPWTIAIGNIIAPAIKNPHLSSEKQTKRCVNHAAADIPISAIAAIGPIFISPFFYKTELKNT